MKHGWLSWLLLTGFAVAYLAPRSYADIDDKHTQVTFRAPVEIPGQVLPAGTYVMRLLSPVTYPNVVQFLDRDQRHLYAMVSTIPIYRATPTDRTVITFEERTGDAPQAIKEWFYPGETLGQEFLYGQPRTESVAQAAPPPAQSRPTPVPAPASAPATTAATPKPAPQPQPQHQPQPQAPVQVAQATPAPSQPAAPAAAQKKELPKTASDLPLAAVLGGFLLLAGAGLRRRTVA